MHNKHYLVVGGSSGIGLEVVKRLLAQGATVSVISRTADTLANLDVHHHSADVLADDLKQLDLPERLDGLVYCPGSITLKPFRSLKPEQFLADYQINVLGAVKSIQAALKPLKKAGESSVVLYSTVAVGQGMSFHASIAAAKGAVEGLTRSIAAELAPAIRVNCIAPSLTDTPLAERLLSTDDKREASNLRHPLKRVGTPEDIAAATLFLLSDQSSWVTGQIFGIDGGMSALKM